MNGHPQIVTILVTMVRRQPYSLVYAPEVREHLRAIERQHYSLIRETIEEQLDRLFIGGEEVEL